MTSQLRPDELIRTTVAERAAHGSPDDVADTLSFARADGLIGREYHGRFLIELLQNAADAWRDDPRSADRGTHVAIVLDPGSDKTRPALLVANQGLAVTPEVVVSSLGHIGASTKAEGHAIGHKGIGFKSVLELTSSPEIYSGLAGAVPQLAVRFDPAFAEQAVREHSPDWDELYARAARDADSETPLPVLRFPHWVDEPPPLVGALAGEGFDTVVRLPWSDRSGIDVATWWESVDTALRGVTDEVVLLLGGFECVEVRDLRSGDTNQRRPVPVPAGAWPGAVEGAEAVEIHQDGSVTSRWVLWRTRIEGGGPDLAAEAAVGVRLDPSAPGRVVAPVEGETAAPFHLFFPTSIPSGTPFLVHGYFRVDAARTGFYRGADRHNRRVLGAAARLAAEAVAALAAAPDVDPVPLACLLATPAEPEDELAAWFHHQLLDLLDEVAWVPLEGGGTAAPRDVLAHESRVLGPLAAAFPVGYVQRRTGLSTASTELDDRTLALVGGRGAADRTRWDLLSLLLRPGADHPWPHGEEDTRFRALLDLITVLDGDDRDRTTELLDGLRGDEDARLLPVVDRAGTRRLLPVPDPSSASRGSAALRVMARTGEHPGEDLTPPVSLGVAFVPDGLATSADFERAARLGVTAFSVDTVLDRVASRSGPEETSGELARFLWALLSRERHGSERQSRYSTARQAASTKQFNLVHWSWFEAGADRSDEVSRRRGLTTVPLPCRDGVFRPAGEVSFGADWADWIEENAGIGWNAQVAGTRADAYRCLERLCPEPGALLAPPPVVLAMLPEPQLRDEDVTIGQLSAGEAGIRLQQERLAFLLQLGVWEVPPVDSFDNWEQANRDRFPWTGQWLEYQRRAIERDNGWWFGWSESDRRPHNPDKVWLAQDHRLRWSLTAMSATDASALVRALELAAPLYEQRRGCVVFCRDCSRGDRNRHKGRRDSAQEPGYPSQLAVQLATEEWMPHRHGAERADGPAAPQQLWWTAERPRPAALPQSPYRFLGYVTSDGDDVPAVSERLAALAGVQRLDAATAEELLTLLDELRPLSVGTAAVVRGDSNRRALVTLHRLVYERLAALVSDDPEQRPEWADALEVLCELGSDLVRVAVSEAFHDDASGGSAVRHVAGLIPLVVVARDRRVTATRLGVRPLELEVRRQGDDVGTDVTDDVSVYVTDRAAELLAVMTTHSLGSEVMRLESDRFRERAAMLQALRVVQVDDLVVDVRVRGTEVVRSVGRGSDQDLHLDLSSAAHPVLFHDLQGPDWVERFGRRAGRFLAELLGNPAYGATFEVLLQRDGPQEREDYLYELGVMPDDVAAVRAQLGLVDRDQREHWATWFTALVGVLGGTVPDDPTDPAAVRESLAGAPIGAHLSDALVGAGGGPEVRRSTHSGSPLQLLNEAGIDLAVLDGELRALGDAGLRPGVSEQRLAAWLTNHRARCAVVLERAGAADPTAALDRVHVPEGLRLAIEPALPEVLEGVVAMLAENGVVVDPQGLADQPAPELARASGLGGAAELDELVRGTVDDEVVTRRAAARAVAWRAVIVRLGTVLAVEPSYRPSDIRSVAERVDRGLLDRPTEPADLVESLGEALGSAQHLAAEVRARLENPTADVPDIAGALLWAAGMGVDVSQADRIAEAIDGDARAAAARVEQEIRTLQAAKVVPARPPGLTPPGVGSGPDGGDSGPGSGKKSVAAIKVGERADKRKRELGDRGELWALSAVVGELLRLVPNAQRSAFTAMRDLLTHFDGTPVKHVRSLLDELVTGTFTEDDLLIRLTAALRVSSVSDGFGFDLLGFLPPYPGAPPRAMCLEVKSSKTRQFHLSTGEWTTAQLLSKRGDGGAYAVLVVRRGTTGGAPASMDLLADPVDLVQRELLSTEADGYTVAYRS